jgi:hypothetical protein
MQHFAGKSLFNPVIAACFTVAVLSTQRFPRASFLGTVSFAIAAPLSPYCYFLGWLLRDQPQSTIILLEGLFIAGKFWFNS